MSIHDERPRRLACAQQIRENLQWRSPGVRMTTYGRSSHSATIEVASTMVNGCANARALVLMRRKAGIVCHEKQKMSGAES